MKSQPVLTAGSIVGVIMAGLVMAVSLGWLKLDSTQMGNIETFLAAAVALLLPILGAWWASRRVTPTAAPKTADGQPAVIIPQSMVTPEFMAQIPTPNKDKQHA